VNDSSTTTKLEAEEAFDRLLIYLEEAREFLSEQIESARRMRDSLGSDSPARRQLEGLMLLLILQSVCGNGLTHRAQMVQDRFTAIFKQLRENSPHFVE
jgi:hypothetical protein